MKRIVSFALVLIISVSGMLVSCTGNGTELTGTDAYNTSDSPNRGDVIDDLPTLDYDGATISIYSVTQSNFSVFSFNEFSSDSINMDVLNDAIYNREQHVSKRLNVKFRYKYSVDEDVSETLRRSVMTGLDEYQIAGDAAHAFVENAVSGILMNVLNKERFPYLNLEQPWWSSYYAENAKVGDYLFTFTGDYNLSYIRGMYATFFNKALCEQLSIPNLYEIVDSGKWTIDKQIELTSMAYRDVTGDGVTKDDIFGFGNDFNPDSDVYWAAFNLELITRNSDGKYEISFGVDHLTDVTSKLSALFNDNKAFFYYPKMLTDAEMDGYNHILVEKFSQDELLFMSKSLFACDSTELRNMKSEYGIIPLPKWDEAQDDYYTAVAENYTLLGIPKTAVRTDMVSAVLEALCSDSYRYVTPAYYNKVLKGRYMSDPESTAMIDKITANYKVDFGVIYSVPLKRLAHNLMRNFLLGENGTSLSRYWASTKKMYTYSLDRMIKTLEKNAKQ